MIDLSERCPWRRWRCGRLTAAPWLAPSRRSSSWPGASCGGEHLGPVGVRARRGHAGSESDGCEVYSETAYVLGSLPTLPNPLLLSSYKPLIMSTQDYYKGNPGQQYPPPGRFLSPLRVTLLTHCLALGGGYGDPSGVCLYLQDAHFYFFSLFPEFPGLLPPSRPVSSTACLRPASSRAYVIYCLAQAPSYSHDPQNTPNNRTTVSRLHKQ